MADPTNSVLSRLERPSGVLGFVLLSIGAAIWGAGRYGLLETEVVRAYAMDGGVVLGAIGGVLVAAYLSAQSLRAMSALKGRRELRASERDLTDRLMVDMLMTAHIEKVVLYRMLNAPLGRMPAMKQIDAFDNLRSYSLIVSESWGLIGDGDVVSVNPLLFAKRQEASEMILRSLPASIGVTDVPSADHYIRIEIGRAIQRTQNPYGF